MIGVVIVLTALAPLAVAGYFWNRSRSFEEVTFHYFRCPGCSQKLRSQAKTGSSVMCPRCRKRCNPVALARQEACATQDRGRQLVGQRVMLRAS